MRLNKKIIEVSIIALVLVFVAIGCSKSAIKENSSVDDISNSSIETTQDKSETQQADYNELKKNAILQYPSSNDYFNYNVYQDTISHYKFFVEITGYKQNKPKRRV